MDGFGMGLVILTTLLLITICVLPLHSLIKDKNFKSLFILIPATVIYIYFTDVILTGDRKSVV